MSDAARREEARPPCRYQSGSVIGLSPEAASVPLPDDPSRTPASEVSPARPVCQEPLHRDGVHHRRAAPHQLRAAASDRRGVRTGGHRRAAAPAWLLRPCSRTQPGAAPAASRRTAAPPVPGRGTVAPGRWCRGAPMSVPPRRSPGAICAARSTSGWTAASPSTQARSSTPTRTSWSYAILAVAMRRGCACRAWAWTP